MFVLYIDTRLSLSSYTLARPGSIRFAIHSLCKEISTDYHILALWWRFYEGLEKMMKDSCLWKGCLCPLSYIKFISVKSIGWARIS